MISSTELYPASWAIETERPLFAAEAGGSGISFVQLPSPMATSTRSYSDSSFTRLASLKPLIDALIERPIASRCENGSIFAVDSFHLLKPVGESGSKTALDSRNFWMIAEVFGV